MGNLESDFCECITMVAQRLIVVSKLLGIWLLFPSTKSSIEQPCSCKRNLLRHPALCGHPVSQTTADCS